MASKTFLVINKRSGKALTLNENNHVIQSEITYSDDQLWTTVKHGTKVKLINKSCGKNLDLMFGGTDNSTTLHLWDDVSSDSQLWSLVTSSRGYKKIINSASDKVVDIVMLSDENGAFAQIWDDIGGENQEWKVVEYPAPAKKQTVVRQSAKKETTAKTANSTKETKVAKTTAKKATEKKAPAKKTATKKTSTKSLVQ